VQNIKYTFSLYMENHVISVKDAEERRLTPEEQDQTERTGTKSSHISYSEPNHAQSSRIQESIDIYQKNFVPNPHT